MSNEKSISECYEEIKQREIEELKKKVRRRGGKYGFDEDWDAPEVLCNLKYEGPVDVMITSVEVDANNRLIIDGKPHYHSGCDSSYGHIETIGVSEIAYGEMSVICEAIPSPPRIKQTELVCETIVLLAADLYQKVYDKCECYTEACREIVRIANQFEEELNWVENDERDYIIELEKFEERYLESIGD